MKLSNFSKAPHSPRQKNLEGKKKKETVPVDYKDMCLLFRYFFKDILLGTKFCLLKQLIF